MADATSKARRGAYALEQTAERVISRQFLCTSMTGGSVTLEDGLGRLSSLGVDRRGVADAHIPARAGRLIGSGIDIECSVDTCIAVSPATASITPTGRTILV